MINIWNASLYPDTEDGSIIYWGINKKVTKTYYERGATTNPFSQFYGVVDWWYDVEYNYNPKRYQSEQFWYRYTPASGTYSHVYNYTTAYAYYLTGSYLGSYTYYMTGSYTARYAYYLTGSYKTLYNYIYTGIYYQNLYA